jgi:hypothetical protein
VLFVGAPETATGSAPRRRRTSTVPPRPFHAAWWRGPPPSSARFDRSADVDEQGRRLDASFPGGHDQRRCEVAECGLDEAGAGRHACRRLRAIPAHAGAEQPIDVARMRRRPELFEQICQIRAAACHRQRVGRPPRPAVEHVEVGAARGEQAHDARRAIAVDGPWDRAIALVPGLARGGSVLEQQLDEREILAVERMREGVRARDARAGLE